ncbi:fumarylacetoacetate hydrolase [Rhizobium leguminosarum bv. trifolii]|jgi:fumarylacetoacetate (FAA) hydrolase family protein|uniref:Fumarylacetoacetate hydrolase n=1 Tax=Rhizobium leguminosarum bv. trifolii TaxID=386 RepID=A0A1B8RKF3_RHILT|nr:fumarylacetoacetate hydrolase family protein [Rhizobium leguminosarum]AOO87940.1 fumarylacetoacetate hydrolase [Rhizobium leguminosarum bv. trifolii]MBA8832318.1 fumarylacetoacetate (FAA) hydrolase family protein [Rhizobium leguminosarum]MDH6274939.1 fumarylacetoacetate (FAA) hydrolase family protein [Rhizobium leguminosarum]MVO92624.1 fumarylacetoacetate hydrolase [Rhizobium leguminosarum bv. phaseoli]OBY09248.1 fumarylacetoacetate hydrolase [Rhizobium leguminosarum bv. trifolii]
MSQALLDVAASDGLFVGRIWNPEAEGPSIVTLRQGMLVDITSRETPTLSALLERQDAAAFVRAASGKAVGSLADIAANSTGAPDQTRPYLLAPVDLQAVKACGVTFAQSMIERVIEEKAAGNPERAASIRERVSTLIGGSLTNLKAGSPEAAKVKQTLIDEGMWSQYLEVGIGPDAEVFTKSPVLSSVGWGADVGLHPISTWNNPEPEIVLAVNSRGEIKGAALGNDVNLRDVEGRSALLLGKAKDNNASCSIGPFIRLFDAGYSLDDVRKAELDLKVTGQDGFVLHGKSSMSKISRDPTDLVKQTVGAHHQYPDGFMLFLGTLFAPTQDRDAPNQGFTHKIGDVVEISSAGLGALVNTVRLSTECPPWTFGISALMSNLAKRGLL